MPYVNIKVTREGTAPGATSTTAEQKAALIKGVSDLLFDILGKPHYSTFVVIDEIEMESWGVGGLPVPEYRKRLAEKAAKQK
jgi:4-oxalocrotonate tautomerase